MARVIRKFRERLNDLKLYKIGDEYPNENQERVQYLVSQGYLEAPKEEFSTQETQTLEEFASLSAAGQKKLLADLGVEGDDSKAEKREALYREYLGADPSARTADAGEVNLDGDPNA